MIEGLHSLKSILQNGDFICRMDLKDAHFVIPLSEGSRKFVRLEWTSFCVFGLAPVPRIFPKLMKVAISLQCSTFFPRTTMLLFGQYLEIFMGRATIFFLSQKLGFIINLKKPILEPIKNAVQAFRQTHSGSFASTVWISAFQITATCGAQTHFYRTETVLNQDPIKERSWWIQNLELYNGRSLIQTLVPN